MNITDDSKTPIRKVVYDGEADHVGPVLHSQSLRTGQNTRCLEIIGKRH